MNGKADKKQQEGFSSADRSVRLEKAKEIGASIADGTISRTETDEINNHVHTIYSFSPYSPSEAAYCAWTAGLQTVGAMDHDSVAGCEEMLDAGKAIGIATTVGCELRVSMTGTDVEGRKINNPDSANIAYIALHGIPRNNLGRIAGFLEPVHEARNTRNRGMTDRLNEVIKNWGIGSLDFDRDVRAISRADEGGSITERHLLFATAKRLVEHKGRGSGILDFLSERAGIDVPSKIAGYLGDPENPHYLYDLLGVFKSTIIEQIYIQPDEKECLPVARVLEQAHEAGAIPAYAYLGDVTSSPTGDKKPEKFEDEYLDELFDVLTTLGFQAVTYMPPRNTIEQLRRVQKLCKERGLMEISGVDINSSRQSFNCPEVTEPEFRHLIDAAWALIAHEKLSARDPAYALFSRHNRWKDASLSERIRVYASIGRKIDPGKPEEAVAIAEDFGGIQ